MLLTALATLCVPLLVATLLLLLPKRWAPVSGCIGAFVVLGLAVQLATHLAMGVSSASITWLYLPGAFTATAGLYLDVTARILVLVVAFVSAAVHVFSVWYTRGYAHQRRYFATLSLFVFAMLGLVLSSDLWQLFICWELVGFCSYLLIGFYRTEKAAKAATQAFWVNRVADACLLAGLFLAWQAAGSLQVEALLRINWAVQPLGGWIGTLILLGAMGKSAQLPFHGWLPDAMTGPTPVSALIHAATMVAAGVFLLVRLSPLLTPDVLDAALWVGVLTAGLASLIALWQWDIKRLLAFSTVAQLGYMVAAVGLGAPHMALFHLVTHAAFKAGLFLSAGSVLRSVGAASQASGISHNASDLSQLGGLFRKLPVTASVAALCGAALAGLPLTAGYASKDLILLHALEVYPPIGWLLLGSAALTVAYAVRWWWLVFGGTARMPHQLFCALDERSLVQRGPLLLLGFLSIGVFYLPVVHALGLASTHGSAALFLAIGLTVFAVLSMLVVRYLERSGRLVVNNHTMSEVFEFYFPGLYQWLGRTTAEVDARLLAWIDRWVVDGFVRAAGALVARFQPVLGDVSLAASSRRMDERMLDGLVGRFANSVVATGKSLQRLQPGGLQHVLAYTLVGLVLVGALLATGFYLFR